MGKEQEISYSQCWEDPVLVEQGLNLSSQDNLVIISSGGDNVLNLSLVHPSNIIAIDNNPSQNYLLELKIAGIKLLNYESFISFLGLDYDNKRWDKYLKLRGYLSPKAVLFWDSHKKFIKHGILDCGRFEKFVKIFRNFILPLIHNRQTIKRLFSFETIDEQKEFYNAKWLNYRWKLLFYLFFDQNILGRFGRSKKMFAYSDTKKTGKYFFNRLDNYFSNTLVKNNYFLHYLFMGLFPAPFYPPYLGKDNYYRLKSNIDCIKIVTDDIMNYIDKLDKNKVYKFCLSDIFESYSEEDTEFFFNKLINHCNVGSGVCFWNNLVVRHPKENNKLLNLREYSDRLQCKDRLFFYKKFFIYERK